MLHLKPAHVGSEAENTRIQLPAAYFPHPAGPGFYPPLPLGPAFMSYAVPHLWIPVVPVYLNANHGRRYPEPRVQHAQYPASEDPPLLQEYHELARKCAECVNGYLPWFRDEVTLHRGMAQQCTVSADQWLRSLFYNTRSSLFVITLTLLNIRRLVMPRDGNGKIPLREPQVNAVLHAPWQDLFLAVFMLSHKVREDDTYSTRSFCTASQWTMQSTTLLATYERAILYVLDWNVDCYEWDEFSRYGTRKLGIRKFRSEYFAKVMQ